MGYRSQVAGIIKFKSLEDREKFVILAKAHGGLIAKNFDDGANLAEWTWDTDEAPHKEDPIMTFEYDDVKWYESYDDVKCHYDLCRYAEETFEASWRIVSVGEDGQEDAHESGDDTYSLEEYIYTSHSLHTTF